MGATDTLPGMGLGKSDRGAALLCLALTVIGLAFHLPHLADPLHAGEINAGAYFGSFLRNWEAFGFFDLSGMMLTPQLAHGPDLSTPYFNHPPGLAWTMWLLGGDEMAVRLPTALGVTAASVIFFLLLRRSFGLWWAFGAAFCVLGSPSFTFWLQASLEPVVLPLGLLLLLLTQMCNQASGRRRQRLHLAQVAICLVGPWMDWAFLYFCVGLVPLAWDRSLWRMVGRLLPAALASSLSLGLFFLWKDWALSNEILGASSPNEDVASIVEKFILTRPPLSEFLVRGAQTTAQANTELLLGGGLMLAGLFAYVSVRLFLALLCVAGLHPAIFPHHALDHVHFWGYCTPLLAASMAAGSKLTDRRFRVAIGALLVLSTGVCWFTSFDYLRQSRTPVLAEIGQYASKSVRDETGRDHLIATNFPVLYPFYVTSPFVLAPQVIDPEVIENARQVRLKKNLKPETEKKEGIYYLRVKVSDAVVRQAPEYGIPPELHEYLSAFEQRRIPDLEKEFYDPRTRTRVRIEEVWMHTLIR